MERRPSAASDLDDLLTIRVSAEAGSHRVLLSGEFDLSSRAAVIAACTADRFLDVVVDLKELTFLDCAGYQGLLDARLVLVRRGGSLAVINVGGEPRYLLDLIEAVEPVPW